MLSFTRSYSFSEQVERNYHQSRLARHVSNLIDIQDTKFHLFKTELTRSCFLVILLRIELDYENACFCLDYTQLEVYFDAERSSL